MPPMRMSIDGSDRAKTIATSVLSGTSVLWGQVTEGADLPEPALTCAHDAVTKGHAEMIDASREDFGG